MSGWDFIRKMAQGKPVFEPSDVHNEPKPETEQPSGEVPTQRIEVAPAPAPAAAPPVTTPLVDDQGHKMIPQLVMTHCRSHVNDGRLEVTAWITNASTVAVRITEIVLLDQKTHIDRDLEPGQAHEAVLYRGPAPQDDTSHKAELYYKIKRNGDNFCADYMIEYYREANGAWLIEELHPAKIVRDV